MGVYPWPQTNEWGFVLVSSMSEAICQASAHTESVVGYGRLGRLRAGTNAIYSRFVIRTTVGHSFRCPLILVDFRATQSIHHRFFFSYGFYVCLCAGRAARGGPRRARVRPKTQAEMRQQQSAVGHNPLMLVTVALLSRMGYGC